DSLRDLRFVAMRFVPADTADFLQLNRMVFSQGLKRNVAGDTTIIGNVAPGPFPYSGVAQQFSPDPFAWRPGGVVAANGGLFVVQAGETTDVHVEVADRSPPNLPADPCRLVWMRRVLGTMMQSQSKLDGVMAMRIPGPVSMRLTTAFAALISLLVHAAPAAAQSGALS